ncbi:MAG: alpha/beta hydrolase [Sphingomonadales bacterium]|nr:alpha/beta hydrolase [Sphingomonadales bacterium]MBD3774512.1 alpha/beta hydrolase [Paracoccaceae bacterium]
MAETEHYVRADVRAFLDMLAAMGRPQLHEMGVEEAREASRTMTALADADPRDLPVIRNLTCPGPAGDIPVRLYDSQADATPRPTIAFFHGGGFTIGCLESYHSLCSTIAAETGLPVVSVDYRLAPEHPFPAAPDDCEAAARWIAENPAELGLQTTGIVPMGDSAGGNLTIVITQALVDEPAAVPVVMQVPIYPIATPIAHHASFAAFGEGFLLTREAMGWFTDCYAPDDDSARNYPILWEGHGKTPPTVLVTAGLDPLRDSGREYAAHLIQNGVDVTYLEMRGTIHGFVNIRKAIPSGNKDMAAMFAAMKMTLEHNL